MDKTTVMAYFSIYGDIFEPEDVTHRLGIVPTEVKVKGIVPDGKKRPSIETSWKISTKDEESMDLNTQLSRIVELLESKVDELCDIKLSLSVNFTFSFIVKIENGEKPAMNFPPEKLKFIGDIGAEIDIDLYIYS
ncbi:DUF4279 domain-containing protein [Enterobacteriaceae bacterium 4M9]|nr:DUF4279 domain-containing protein [Enterobacteriaceae bacterium 4M9]